MDEKKQYISIEKSKIKIIPLFVVLLIFLLVFLVNRDFYIADTSKGAGIDILWMRIFKLGFCYLLVILTIIIKIEINNIVNLFLSFASLLIVPIMNYYFIEYINNIEISAIPINMSLYNISIIAVIMLMFIVITGSFRVSGVLTTAITALFGVACYYLLIFKNTPLLFSDFFNIKTAAEVAGSYTYKINFEVYVFLFFCFFLCTLLLKLDKLTFSGLKIRAIFLVLFVFSGYLLVDSVVLKKKLGELYINPWDTYSSYKSYGSYLTLLSSARVTIVQKPEGYSVEKVKEIEKKYSYEPTEQENELPNVIMILNESFTDFQNIGGHFNTNKEVLPFYNSMTENTIKGNCYSSSYAGGTINPEFEFLSSSSLYCFPSSSYPYQYNVKSEIPSVISVLKNLGYQGNIAIHPADKTNYNRDKIYDFLGFEKFYGYDDFHKPKKIEGYVSDESVYNMIIDEYEKYKSNSDKPFSAFALTMQNHGGYTERLDNLDVTIRITDNFTQEEKGESNEVERALTLMNLSDKAIQNLVEYFEEKDDKTIIILFGDHQPVMPAAFYKKVVELEGAKELDSTLATLKVPFFIWANYDIPEQEYDHMSLNYLCPIAFEAADISSPAFYKQMNDLRKDILSISNFGFVDKNGIYYRKEATDYPESYRKELLDYNYSVYNSIIDKNNRVESFFNSSKIN